MLLPRAGQRRRLRPSRRPPTAPLQFTYEGALKTGEFKLVSDATVLKDYAGPYIQAPEAGVTLSHEGVSKQGMVAGGADNKWTVTEAGTYKTRLRRHEPYDQGRVLHRCPQE